MFLSLDTSNFDHFLHYFVVQTGCTEGKIRLVGGKSDKEGDIQICHQGVWGYTCGYYWNSDLSRVVCQQLKFSTLCEWALQIQNDFRTLLSILLSSVFNVFSLFCT